MFESEDMLPRRPPQPSAPPLASDGFVKPEVPEVSIIFGKTNNLVQIPPSQQPQPSYAAWKKQMLPRANYPAVTKNENNSNTNGYVATARSNVFPLRTVSAPVIETQIHEHSTRPTSAAAITEKQYRHSLENTNGTTPTLNFTLNKEYRRSVDSLTQRSTAFSTESALTICASTQTDNNSTNSCHSQQELENLMKAINVLQEEQRQTRRLLETFIMQQEQKQQQQQMVVADVLCCDMGVQCDMFKDAQPLNIPPAQLNFQLENGTVHQALPNVKIYSPTTTKDATRPLLPTAQSTQYRNNTPLKSNTQPPATNHYLPVLPKACTDKSMVMNELALKYLPSEKLNELMQDTNTAADTTPLREIDNFNKAPTDISTASFHYLRKYRLLPQQQKQSESATPQNAVNMPAYNQQHQPAHNSPVAEAESPHLDFEHIKRQPKFL